MVGWERATAIKKMARWILCTQATVMPTRWFYRVAAN